MDWLPITISAILLAAAAVWTIFHEDSSMMGRGKHRSRRGGTA